MNEQERKFIEGWRIAGPVLERLRNEKLARLDESEGLKSLGANVRPAVHRHGMAIMQAWFTRLRIKQLTDEVKISRQS